MTRKINAVRIPFSLSESYSLRYPDADLQLEVSLSVNYSLCVSFYLGSIIAFSFYHFPRGLDSGFSSNANSTLNVNWLLNMMQLPVQIHF